MAGIGNTLENDILELLFKATAIANVADNAASSPITNVEYSLHAGDVGETGTQTTNEIGYTSYARVAVARSGSGHTVTANSVSPAATVGFPQGSGGSGTASHFATGQAHTSTGKVWWYGTISPNIVTGNLITPQLSTATAMTID